MSANTVLILKTSDNISEVADAIKAKGFEAMEEAILKVEYLENEFPVLEPGRALIFTSPNGVRAFARKVAGRTHPVYTVGPNTADEAKAVGFDAVESGGGTLIDLADFLINLPKEKLFSPFYVRAEDVSGDLGGILGKSSIHLDEFIAYRAVPADNLSLNLLQKLDRREIKAIMFFSRRGAKTFGELAEQYGRLGRLKGIKALCISDGVVESVSVLPFEAALAAKTPDRYGMIELLEKLSIS